MRTTHRRSPARAAQEDSLRSASRLTNSDELTLTGGHLMILEVRESRLSGHPRLAATRSGAYLIFVNLLCNLARISGVSKSEMRFFMLPIVQSLEQRMLMSVSAATLDADAAAIRADFVAVTSAHGNRLAINSKDVKSIAAALKKLNAKATPQVKANGQRLVATLRHDVASATTLSRSNRGSFFPFREPMRHAATPMGKVCYFTQQVALLMHSLRRTYSTSTLIQPASLMLCNTN